MSEKDNLPFDAKEVSEPGRKRMHRVPWWYIPLCLVVSLLTTIFIEAVNPSGLAFLTFCGVTAGVLILAVLLYPKMMDFWEKRF